MSVTDADSAGPKLVTPVPGPKSRAAAARLAAVECPAFDARRKGRGAQSGEEHASLVYARGLGSNLWDVDGNRFVDLVLGFGALSFGYGAPLVLGALHEAQELLLMALGDVYSSETKVALLEALVRLMPEAGARVLLGLSGADAVTAGLKTAALATGKAGVIAFEGAYHGLSHGPLAACGYRASFREPFAHQTGDFVRFAPYPSEATALDASLNAVRDGLRSGNVGAVLVEPILGRGGCVVPPPAFLPSLAALCKDAGALLVVDEVWTGMGRSGSMLLSVEQGVLADVVCVGKALGGGAPISACIGRGSVMEAWGASGGSAIHTATHFGSPPACAAALAVMQALTPQRLAAIREKGDAFRRVLSERLLGRGVRSVRGRGLIVGIELDGDGARALAVASRMLRAGYLVLTGGTAGNVLTLTPSYEVDARLFEPFAAALDAALNEGAS